MSSTLTSPILKENIKLSYVNNSGVLVEGATISDVNSYEQRNPGTTYIFLDGDNKYRYLNIDQVNELTPQDLITTKIGCDTTPKPVGSPKVVFSGGGGIGAEANPIISPGGVLLGIDIANPGVGYQTPPVIKIFDEANIGSGAVVQAVVENGSVINGIVLDSGSNYIPAAIPVTPPPTAIPVTPPPTAILDTAILDSQIPRYPVILSLKEVIVNNPGINYNPEVDVLEITPNNGAILQAVYTPFGQVTGVKVVRPGIGFVVRPNITIRSESGINADFTPVFEIIRDPILFSPQLQQRKIITVVDTVGLQVQGYVSGKPYYGNIYYDGGLKYAGPYKSFDSEIRVYDTLSESIK